MIFRVGRGRRELNIDHLKRPSPTGDDLEKKSIFASQLLAEEHDWFGTGTDGAIANERYFERPVRDMMKRQNGATSVHKDLLLALENDWAGTGTDGVVRKVKTLEGSTRDMNRGHYGAGDVLKGLLMRGRYQAAVFQVYMELCRREICSIRALEVPIDWDKRESGSITCHAWILGMLTRFEKLQHQNFLDQQSWGISSDVRWDHYDRPICWLAIMIGRTFTSLAAVVHTIQETGQFGPCDKVAMRQWARQAVKSWEADPQLCSNDRYSQSGTLSFWLPHSIDPDVTRFGFKSAANKLAPRFYNRLEWTEYYYAMFYGIDQKTFNADISHWEAEVGKEWD